MRFVYFNKIINGLNYFFFLFYKFDSYNRGGEIEPINIFVKNTRMH